MGIIEYPEKYNTLAIGSQVVLLIYKGKSASGGLGDCRFSGGLLF